MEQDNIAETEACIELQLSGKSQEFDANTLATLLMFWNYTDMNASVYSWEEALDTLLATDDLNSLLIEQQMQLLEAFNINPKHLQLHTPPGARSQTQMDTVTNRTPRTVNPKVKNPCNSR